MANVVKCPVCGESNLPDQEFCQYCQARMQPLTGNLKGADATLKPGQAPTKKNTAELEPVLPQWLREARSTARQTSEEEAKQAAQQPVDSHPASSGADLLAGLHAQRQAQDNEEEDTPDWLANITGETPKTKKSQPESSDVRWVELGDTNDFAQQESASDTPDWLKGLNPSASQSNENDELTDWMRGANDSQKPQQSSQPFSFDVPYTPPDTPPSTPPVSDTPDWLHSMAADGGGFNDSGNTGDEALISSDDAPDWLRTMDAENTAQNINAPLSNSGTPPVSSDTPDWLRAMDAENTAQNINAPLSNSGTPPVSSDTPDWLRTIDAENDTPSNISSTPPAPSDVPDWLHTMDAEDKTQSADSVNFSKTISGESDAARSSTGEAPDWLKSFESDTPPADLDWLKAIPTGESQQPVPDSAPAWLNVDTSAPVEKNEPHKPNPQEPSTASEKDDSESDVPSWLKAAAPQSSIYDEPVVEQETPAPISPSSDTPDWLNAFKPDEPPETKTASAFSKEVPVDSAPPAFSDNNQPRANGDSLFTEMPDWLSIVDDSVSPVSIPASSTNVDAIAPGDLPSWVQAMRPVDAGVPQSSSTSLSGDTTLESHGALAGLQGVLPAVPGFSPTSKPKAYSIKMKASEEQQAHAALLEKILEAETAPVPIGNFSALRTSRALRWLLALLFFAGLTTVLFMRTQIFSMPVGLPLEVVDSLNVVRSIPEGAPVLVAFDYEPARVGEMEAAAVPVFDQMMILRHPQMTFISTNETGAILADRFISGPLGGYNYQSGVQYLNLGYLPGGPMGIRAFVENPSVTAPYALAQNPKLFDFALTPGWKVPPLSQFAALIVITDNADSARAWIEQTTSARGTNPAVPFVVISSAQAAPMIQPYYASHQINGLVSGLYGGALVEQNNAGRPGTARTYWDAYSIGMLLAMVLILGGGLLNLALGLRDRAAAREAK